MWKGKWEKQIGQPLKRVFIELLIYEHSEIAVGMASSSYSICFRKSGVSDVYYFPFVSRLMMCTLSFVVMGFNCDKMFKYCFILSYSVGWRWVLRISVSNAVSPYNICLLEQHSLTKLKYSLYLSRFQIIRIWLFVLYYRFLSFFSTACVLWLN